MFDTSHRMRGPLLYDCRERPRKKVTCHGIKAVMSVAVQVKIKSRVEQSARGTVGLEDVGGSVR